MPQMMGVMPGGPGQQRHRGYAPNGKNANAGGSWNPGNYKGKKQQGGRRSQHDQHGTGGRQGSYAGNAGGRKSARGYNNGRASPARDFGHERKGKALGGKGAGSKGKQHQNPGKNALPHGAPQQLKSSGNSRGEKHAAKKGEGSSKSTSTRTAAARVASRAAGAGARTAKKNSDGKGKPGHWSARGEMHGGDANGDAGHQHSAGEVGEVLSTRKRKTQKSQKKSSQGARSARHRILRRTGQKVPLQP